MGSILVIITNTILGEKTGNDKPFEGSNKFHEIKETTFINLLKGYTQFLCDE